MEVLTIEDMAALLKMTRRQVYELTRERNRARSGHPVPLIRVNGNTRFLRAEVEKWLAELAKEGAA